MDRSAGKDDVMTFKHGIFTRGVLFDIARHKGVPYLGDQEAIYPEDLEACEKKAGFRLERGDAMLVRTGRWLRVKVKGALDLNRQTPGLYASCANSCSSGCASAASRSMGKPHRACPEPRAAR
jgi:hypothetical protein